MEGETDGIQQLGEVPVITRRNSPSEVDHQQAYRRGATDAYGAVAGWAEERTKQLDRYEDTGILAELIAMLADRVREVNS